MKLYYKIHINSPPLKVWEILSNPNLMELWNPKCVSSKAGQGPFGFGSSYEATFRMGTSPQVSLTCTIEEYELNKLLTTKYSGPAFKMGGYVKETFRLIPKGDRTILKQTVDFGYSGISIIIQLIMKIIHIIGKTSGKGPLDGIKELAEEKEYNIK